ncbi:hypothetical protein [Sporomusa sp.]|nr:hypothetical protein [Sporomusa sp.]HWR06775.1 hypothetical protein [Sporomusa sp.]
MIYKISVTCNLTTGEKEVEVTAGGLRIVYGDKPEGDCIMVEFDTEEIS